MKASAFRPTVGLLTAGLLAAGGVQAEPLFSDDFEDRVRDQATIGNGWTWYEQTFESQVCEGDPIFQVGPFDTPEDDYEQANRNFWTASEEAAGEGDSYFRAGLEVPAWADEEGNSPLGNMLRVYGNPFNEATSCWDEMAPFGGVKRSGVGRMLSDWIFNELSEVKMILFDLGKVKR
ncbi:MAG: hypothetical protein P8Y40_13110 [Desulfobacterales bacterium]